MLQPNKEKCKFCWFWFGPEPAELICSEWAGNHQNLDWVSVPQLGLFRHQNLWGSVVRFNWAWRWRRFILFWPGFWWPKRDSLTSAIRLLPVLRPWLSGQRLMVNAVRFLEDRRKRLEPRMNQRSPLPNLLIGSAALWTLTRMDLQLGFDVQTNWTLHYLVLLVEIFQNGHHDVMENICLH